MWQIHNGISLFGVEFRNRNLVERHKTKSKKGNDLIKSRGLGNNEIKQVKMVDFGGVKSLLTKSDLNIFHRSRRNYVLH